MTRPMDRRTPRIPSALVLATAILVASILAGCDGSVSRSPASSPDASVAAIVGPSPTEVPDTAEPAIAEPTPMPTPVPITTPTPTPDPTPTPTPGFDPPPQAGPFEMDLYRKGDFATEQMPIWCAPAALQTMINIMSKGADTTRATQRRLHRLARRYGPAPDKGSEPEGMAKALESLGFGRYKVLAMPTRMRAFNAAAKAIRRTRRPVALLVWRGAHNWVVSGFRSTADPALGDDFRVTALRIEDVWYPRISSIWGESRPPDALVPVKVMPQDYLPWRRPTGRYPGKDGKFVLIVPVPAS